MVVDLGGVEAAGLGGMVIDLGIGVDRELVGEVGLLHQAACPECPMQCCKVDHIRRLWVVAEEACMIVVG